MIKKNEEKKLKTRKEERRKFEEEMRKTNLPYIVKARAVLKYLKIKTKEKITLKELNKCLKDLESIPVENRITSIDAVFGIVNNLINEKMQDVPIRYDGNKKTL